MVAVAFPGGSVIKNLPANAGDTGNSASIPGSGKSPRVGNASLPSTVVWKISWTKKSGGLQSMEFQRVRHTEQLTHDVRM